MKLDIACGQTKPEGWVGIDQCPCDGADIVHDLTSFPWPIESESVDEARCCHYFEHVPQFDRPKFMSELWRILKPGGTAEMITPTSRTRQAQDFTHCWPPIHSQSYLYFNREWLTGNKLDHYIDAYGIRCNFGVRLHGIALADAWKDVSETDREFAIRELPEAVLDICVILTKLPIT